MNLHDIVRRADRMARVEAGCVTAAEPRIGASRQRALEFGADATLRLVDAGEATALRHLPDAPGWRFHPSPDGQLRVWLDQGGVRHLLFETVAAEPQDVRLHWPLPTPLRFDLVFEVQAGGLLTVGPAFNARPALMPLLRGHGVEVGPGANPAVLADSTRTVTYVERMAAEQWSATYARGQLEQTNADHWQHYVVDSAHELGGFENASLGFIFSSHVFEHLVNPLGVLENWWKKLAPGGVITGVVPDCRYTFDLRQPVSTPDEWRAQRETGSFEPTDAMYERWCRHTQPLNTPEQLRQREYSIHVNFYTPEALRRLFDLFGERHDVAGVHLHAVPNGKDFGFLIAKA